MSHWQEDFSHKMDAICGQSSGRFERFAKDTLDPAFDAIAEFVAQWDFRTGSPQASENRRTYKFALTEDAYVLVTFKIDGVDTLECEYECLLPVTGQAPGVRTTTSLRNVEPGWGQSCFQIALDHFITHFSEAETRKHEPALV